MGRRKRSTSKRLAWTVFADCVLRAAACQVDKPSRLVPVTAPARCRLHTGERDWLDAEACERRLFLSPEGKIGQAVSEVVYATHCINE